MSDFFTETKVQKTRKPHQCRHCLEVIPVGSRALRCSGVWNGDFGSYYSHEECMLAGDGWAHITGCWGEEYGFLRDVKSEGELDKAWLKKFHPIVFLRLYPITQTPA